MKKFFGLLLAVVTTLVLLPCCGGGGDDESAEGVMTHTDYANGRKHFVIGAGTSGTLYFVPAPGGDIEDRRVDGVGEVFVSGQMGATAQVAAKESAGIKHVVSVNNYTCLYDANGVLESAVLSFSYDSGTEDDAATLAFFNLAAADGEVVQGMSIKMEFNFKTFEWSMTDRDAPAAEGEEEPDRGGIFKVMKGTNPKLDYRN